MRNFHLPPLLALLFLTSACLPQTGPEAYVPDEPAGDDDDSAPVDEVVADDDDDDIADDADSADEPVIEPPLTADEDGDNFDDPLFTGSFLGSGAPDLLEYSDAISFLDGDNEDWIAFTTPALENEEVNITFDLVCAGEGEVDAAAGRPWDDEGASPTALSAGDRVNCNEVETVRLETNHDYLLRIHFPNGAEVGSYVEWDLAISW